ncbi:MAG: PspC domain-containing protein [Nocardioides sp.]
MTTTPPEAPPPPSEDTGPRVDGDQVRDLGRLRRSRTDRKVAGVAGGLARHLDVDPLILRVALVVLVFFGGAGLIVYGACWLLVPEDGASRAPFNLDDRSRSVALLVVGGVAALALVGDSWGAFWFPWPVAIVALVALWLLTRNTPDRPPSTPPVVGQQATGWVGAPVVPAGPAPAPAPAAYPQPVQPFHAYVRPPNPRKRGPILFWFALALMALGVGVLGIVDLAGADVPGPAYPALVVAVCGALLLVGAFFGRAGGLIALGLAASVGLAGAIAVDQWETEQVTETPQTAVEVEDRYWLGAGEQVLDLREVSDLDELDDRTIEVEGGVGRIEVILPDGLVATVHATVDGPGNIRFDGEDHGGIELNRTIRVGGSAFDDPSITIDAQIGVGEIEVNHE